MLEMGRAVNILELAKRMIRLSGYRPGVEIPIEITGVRSGEKLAEELAAPDERKNPTDHESIVRLDAHRLAPDALARSLAELRDLVSIKDDQAAAQTLFALTGRHAPDRDDEYLEIDLREMEADTVWNPSVR